MKQEYKDIMMKYLDANPGIEITSNPIGWWRTVEQVGDTVLDSRDSTNHSIVYEELESAITSLYVRNEVNGKFVSYKVVYNSDDKEFVGKVKRKYHHNKSVDVEIDVPEDVWFDTADVRINVDGKSNITTVLTLNVRNGMFPKNIDEIRKQIELNISRKVSEQLQGKGRVRKDIVRAFGLRYGKSLNVKFDCNITTYNNEDLIIKL